MSNFFKNVMSACVNASQRREVERINNQIETLQNKKATLQNNVKVDVSKVIVAKQNTAKQSKFNVTCEKEELLINVAANVQVKDICRNIERKLQRNLSKNSKDDYQLLYNHLFYFYSIKHATTLPIIHGKNKDYDIIEYVAMRTHSVINDVTTHINFS